MKRRYPRLMARVFETPLAIEPGKLQAILAVLGPRFGLDVPADLAVAANDPRRAAAYLDFGDDGKDDPADEQDAGPGYSVVNGVAVLPIMGELVQRSSWMDAASGLVSYETIGSAFRAALADPNAKGILLHVDSPGGEVAGLNELGDEIYAARGTKPIVAVSDDMACSAAYLLASSAEKFYGPQAGAIANIGVICAHVDTSERDSKRGVKVTRFYGGARKGDHFEPLNDGSRAAIQDRCQSLYDLFTSKVARNRGITQQAAAATEAAVYLGPQAVKLGLMDGVASFATVLSDMAGAVNRPSPRFSPAPSVPVTTVPGTVPTSIAKELPMSTPVVVPPAAAAATVTTPDPRDAKIAELQAQVTASEVVAKNERKARRDEVVAKHSKRLSPATMSSMSKSLEPIEDAETVDKILSKMPTEISPKAPEQPTPSASSTTSAGKKDDPEGELIELAKTRVKEKGLTGAALQDAMLEIMKEQPDLKARVAKQRSSYRLPDAPPEGI